MPDPTIVGGAGNAHARYTPSTVGCRRRRCMYGQLDTDEVAARMEVVLAGFVNDPNQGVSSGEGILDSTAAPASV